MTENKIVNSKELFNRAFEMVTDLETTGSFGDDRPYYDVVQDASVELRDVLNKLKEHCEKIELNNRGYKTHLYYIKSHLNFITDI